jgi:primosomal protein N' (replication factor Y)
LELIGTGTERLEEHIRRLFPDARIARLDREAARTASRTDAIRRLFALGELDLLIGTKLLFTGPALPGLGLVGVIYADALLHRPDFRAAERTFHALSQAIEAAASGTEPGRVIIQTALPSHHAFAALATGELVRFYHQETLFRQALNYPPQARLVRLMAAAPQDHTARNLAERCAETIRRLSCTQEALRPVTLLGPTPASPSYLRKRYRWQLLVKAEDQAAASLIVRLSLEALGKIRRKNSEKLDVNVDPLEL